jgi:hypothetical protein
VTRSAPAKRLYAHLGLDPLDCISGQLRERGDSALSAFLDSGRCVVPLFRGYDCGSCLRSKRAYLTVEEDHG